MIFGCKKFFAIEVTKLPIKSYYSTIPLRIWINSIPLGTFNDETYSGRYGYNDAVIHVSPSSVQSPTPIQPTPPVTPNK